MFIYHAVKSHKGDVNDIIHCDMSSPPNKTISYARRQRTDDGSSYGLLAVALSVLSLLAVIPVLYIHSLPPSHSAPGGWPDMEQAWRRVSLSGGGYLINWSCGVAAIIYGLIVTLNKSYSMRVRHMGDLAIIFALIALLTVPAYLYIGPG